MPSNDLLQHSGPDVTIVTICFRNPVELRQTLESIAPVAGNAIENIVVDGSPDDSCAMVVRDFPFVRHVHGRDRGKYDAMNKGIAAAAGLTTIFMNSGDRFDDPAAFAAVATRYRELLGERIIYGDCVKLVAGERIPVPAPPIRPETLRAGVLPSHQSVLVPTAWLRAHPFDDAMEFAADTKSLKRAFAELPHVHVPAAFALFAAGGVSASAGSWSQLARQYREVVAVHEMSRVGAVRFALFLLRRKLVHLVIGERGLQRIQAARLKAKLRREQVEPA